MGISRSDGRHKANSSFHVVPRSCQDFRYFDGVGDVRKQTHLWKAHHSDAKLETAQKYLGDQIKEKMAAPWLHSSLLPKRRKQLVQTERTHFNERERVGSIQAPNMTRVVPVRRCGTFGQCIHHCREHASYQTANPGRDASDASFI